MSVKRHATAKGRTPRHLSPEEVKIRVWIKEHHGILSRIAREFNPPVSPQFVQMIAYSRNGARSKDLRIERRLLSAGCPLLQRLR